MGPCMARDMLEGKGREIVGRGWASRRGVAMVGEGILVAWSTERNKHATYERVRSATVLHAKMPSKS